MRSTILSIFIIIFSFNILLGQHLNVESIGLKTFSNITMVDKGLLQGDRGRNDHLKIGYGIGLYLNSQFGNQFYLNAGLNYVNRRFGSIGALNQSQLPPPRRSFSEEYVAIKSLSYHLIELPVNVGVTFIKKANQVYSFYIGGAANFVLAGNYKNSFSQYDGLYKKNELTGFSVILGVQCKQKLTNDLHFLYGLEYSFYNSIGKDTFISNNGAPAIALDHRFFNLVLGVQKNI